MKNYYFNLVEKCYTICRITWIKKDLLYNKKVISKNYIFSQDL